MSRASHFHMQGSEQERMTPGTSGPTSRQAFAWYDHDSSCWRMSAGTFPWVSDEFSETWPKRGMTRAGHAYELPTSAPPTAAPESSSPPLLPTPAAHEPGGTVEQYRERLRQHDGRESSLTPLGMLVTSLLPTPTANLGSNGGSQHPTKRREGNHQPSIEDVAEHVLLPTPKTTDAHTASPADLNRNSPTLRAVGMLLPTPERNQNIYPRDLSQPQNLENQLVRIGEPTDPPSTDGKPSLHDPLPGQLSLDGTDEND